MQQKKCKVLERDLKRLQKALNSPLQARSAAWRMAEMQTAYRAEWARHRPLGAWPETDHLCSVKEREGLVSNLSALSELSPACI